MNVRPIFLFVLSVLICHPTYAMAENLEEDVPVIASWKEGHGFDADGREISGGWAYDSYNEYYVRFDTDGSVMVKSEEILTTDDYGEYFSDTEQKTETIAVRGNVFQYFEGEIQIVLEDESQKKTEECILNQDNSYSMNLPVGDGTFHIKSADAVWNGKHYLIKYENVQKDQSQEKLQLFELSVLPEEHGEKDEMTLAWEAPIGDMKESAEDRDYIQVNEKSGEESGEPLGEWPIQLIIIGGIFVCSIYKRFLGRKRR